MGTIVALEDRTCLVTPAERNQQVCFSRRQNCADDAVRPGRIAVERGPLRTDNRQLRCQFGLIAPRQGIAGPNIDGEWPRSSSSRSVPTLVSACSARSRSSFAIPMNASASCAMPRVLRPNKPPAPATVAHAHQPGLALALIAEHRVRQGQPGEATSASLEGKTLDRAQR